MRRKFRQLNRADRIKIETLLNAGHKVVDIADYMGVHRSTIYRELKRGEYTHLNSDYTESKSYSCDKAQQNHDWLQTSKGRPLKIGNDIALATFLENKIVDDKYSPEAALAETETMNFKTTISTKTLYRYIDGGVFLKLTNKHLPIKGRRKHTYRRVQKRASIGTTIDKRPEIVTERNTFGHWEMDTVKGKKGITKSCMLVLTERKTRNEIIVKLKDQKSDSVVEALDRLERKWGEMFRNVFRSITVDNGNEFADFEHMERSILHGDKRTFVFYCHPYSSWERGSNENNNRLIRRHIPKGYNIDNKQDADIEYIEHWINNYPRGIFNHKTSAELFSKEIERIS